MNDFAYSSLRGSVIETAGGPLIRLTGKVCMLHHIRGQTLRLAEVKQLHAWLGEVIKANSANSDSQG